MPERMALPQALRDAAKSRTLGSGEVLFRQGDLVVAMYEVVSGRMRMVRHTVDDHVAVMHSAGPGQYLAEAALFTETYNCDAAATVPTQVKVYPKRLILEAIQQDPALAVDVMSSMAQKLRDLGTRFEQHSIRSAKERVTQFLLLAADAQNGSVHLPGTLMDLAGELGLSHEALYRTLAALEKDRSISRSKDQIVLLRDRAV